MPYRMNGWWVAGLGLVGLAAVGIILLLRKDPHQAAQSGPRWKRKLISGGLLLLAAFGVTLPLLPSCDRTGCYMPSPPEYTMDSNDFRHKIDLINTQLPLLEQYAASEAIDANVVRVVLRTAEYDVYLLETGSAKRELPAKEFANAQVLCQKARVSLKALRLRVGFDDGCWTYFEWNRELERKGHAGEYVGPQTQPTTTESNER